MALSASAEDWKPLKVRVPQVSDPGNAAQLAADLEREWLELGKYNVQGCFEYFSRTILRTLAPQMMLYKAARLCNPLSMLALQFSPATVRELLEDKALQAFAPLLKKFDVDALITQLPAYKAAVAGLADRDPAFSVEHIMEFWRMRLTDAPEWCLLVQYMATLHPASAGAERVFSLMKASFGKRQTDALEDYVSGSVMLQYNKRET